MTFINIHTHQPPGPDELAIQSLYKDFETLPATGKYSIGLHPWYIEEATLAAQLAQLKTAAAQSNAVAIGECGLDKLCNTYFPLQQKAFAAQVRLANELNKPLILHCVRAWEEVLYILRQQEVSVPVIFHGFNKNELQAKKIISEGYYLSFGKSLQGKQQQALLAALPPDKISLETDDGSLPIQAIYKLAAAALKIEEDALSLQIEKNIAPVFGAGFLKR